MVFYRNLLAAALRIAPGQAMRAIADVVTGFRTPGHGIPGFERAAARMAVGGIYNLRIHHDDVLRPVLRHLKAPDISGLAAEGLQTQDGIGMFMGGPNEQAARFAERREALLARRRKQGAAAAAACDVRPCRSEGAVVFRPDQRLGFLRRRPSRDGCASYPRRCEYLVPRHEK